MLYGYHQWWVGNVGLVAPRKYYTGNQPEGGVSPTPSSYPCADAEYGYTEHARSLARSKCSAGPGVDDRSTRHRSGGAARSNGEPGVRQFVLGGDALCGSSVGGEETSRGLAQHPSQGCGANGQDCR